MLAILDADGGGFRISSPDQPTTATRPWSPDGRRIAFTGVAPGATEHDLYVLNLAAGTSRRLTTTGARAPAWSSRNRIAYVTVYSQVVGRPRRGQLARSARTALRRG